MAQIKIRRHLGLAGLAHCSGGLPTVEQQLIQADLHPTHPHPSPALAGGAPLLAPDAGLQIDLRPPAGCCQRRLLACGLQGAPALLHLWAVQHRRLGGLHQRSRQRLRTGRCRGQTKGKP